MRTVVTGLLVTGSLVTGCPGGPPQDGLRSGAKFSVLGALREVPRPEDDSLLVVQVADLDTALANSGLERDGALDESAWEWMGPLFSFLGHGEPEAPIYVPLPGVFAPESFESLPAVTEELGWSVVDVGAFVEMNSVPGRFSVVTGGFDDKTLAQLPEVADGVVTAGDGEDLQDQRGSTTLARPLGRPLRMAQSGGRIAASLSLPAVQEWVAGPEDTLADDEELAAVATGLDDSGATTAYLGREGSRRSTHVFRSAPDVAASMQARSAELVGDPFDVVGIGWAAPDGETEITVAYCFDSPAAAEQATGVLADLWRDGTSLLLEQPFSDQFTFADSESAGRVALVHLGLTEGTSTGEILGMLRSGELVFLHQ